MNSTVGIVGLGIMGSQYAKHLSQAGFDVTGFDVVPERVQAVQDAGGVPADSNRQVAANSDYVIVSLPTVESFRAALTGPEGVAAGAHEGLIVIDTCTLPIDVKEEGRAAMAEVGVTMLDCTIGGTGHHAARKEIVVYVSGDEQAAVQSRAVFEGFSRVHHYVGEFGKGSKIKFIHNLLVGIHVVSAAEALVLAMKAGFDPKLVYDLMCDGAGTSRMFEARGPMMAANNYDDTSSTVTVIHKDLELITEFALSLDCPVPLLAASLQYYVAAIAQGRQDQDPAAVCAVVEQLAGVQRQPSA